MSINILRSREFNRFHKTSTITEPNIQVFRKLNTSVACVEHYVPTLYTAQKMKFSIKDFFSKCDQIRRNLRIWSHLLKKSLMENFIFCAVIFVMRFTSGQNHKKNKDAFMLSLS